MNWLVDIPTKFGYYWAYADNFDEPKPILVLVLFDKHGIWDMEGQEYEFDDFGYWKGPIEIPTPPDNPIPQKQLQPQKVVKVANLFEYLEEK